MKNFVFLGLLIATLMAGCTDPTYIPDEINGMKPIYVPLDEISETIKIVPTKETEQLGKIVYAPPYLFVNERFRGIHVYDNSIPTNPTRTRFIEIWGNIDFSVQGNMIYANNLEDLVALKISDFDSVEVTHRIENFYNDQDEFGALFPPNYSGYFECYDESKGFIIGWELTTLLNPQCFI